MSTKIALSKPDLPLWTGGTGALNIVIEVPSVNDPLTRGQGPLFEVGFDVQGNESITFGRAGNMKLTVGAKTKALLDAVFPGDPDKDNIVKDAGLDDYLATHNKELILALRLGAAANAGVSASIPYSYLTATASVDVGGDAGYVVLKAFPQAEPCGTMLGNFARNLALPDGSMRPLELGEAVAFDYGGYLKLGAGVSVGYEMKGTPSIELGKLKLSEHYGFSALGSITGTANVAGRFRINVRGVREPSGTPNGMHWVEVTVHRDRSHEFGIAADVNLSFSTEVGLPGSGLDFLGAVLGINSKNWFNYLKEVSTAKTFDELKAATDTLAWWHLGKVFNKTYSQIESDVKPILDQIQKVVAGYEQFDNRAINLFDRYYDRILVLQNALGQVSQLDSWETLIGKPIDGDLAQVIGALSGSDPSRPLSWVIAMASRGEVKGLEDLKKAASALLCKIHQNVHQEIVRIIQAVKKDFGLGTLMEQLAAVDTPQKLKDQGNTLLGGLASRIVGKSLAAANDFQVFKDAFHVVQDVARYHDKFERELYVRFVDALNSTYSVRLNAAYSSASETDKLIKAYFNLDDLSGRSLFGQACQGNFSGLLEAFLPENMAAHPFAMRLEEAVLTHQISHVHSFQVNIVGWHNRFQYKQSRLDKVLVKTHQQVRPGKNGTLTIYTDVDLTEEKKRASGLFGKEEETHTSFLVHFVAASSGVLQAVDVKNAEYYADCVRAVSASYDLTLKQQEATRGMLDYFLHFASDFGVWLRGMTNDQIANLLPHDTLANKDMNFGDFQAAYTVTYDERGVQKAFSPSITESFIRTTMRRLILAAYAQDGVGTSTARVGRAYCTPNVQEQWSTHPAVFNDQSALQAYSAPRMAGDVPQPDSFTLAANEKWVVGTLFSIEDSLVDAFIALRDIVSLQPDHTVSRISPTEFSQKLAGFGDALRSFDNFSYKVVNPVFALFDQFVGASADSDLRKSSLELSATLNGKTINQVFLSKAVAPPPEGALVAAV